MIAPSRCNEFYRQYGGSLSADTSREKKPLLNIEIKELLLLAA